MLQAWLATALLFAAAPEPNGGVPQEYEQELIAWGLALHHREPEPFPEGKIIEEILVASEDIVAPNDPWPKLINFFHFKTREHVIRREVLMNVGERYSPLLAEETERNLRALFILAVARVIPVKGKQPNGVAILVVTKDLLSIRLNAQFNTVGTLIQRLRIRPSELNLFGYNKQISLDFLLRLDTLSLGEMYTDPRILGTHLALSESAAVILNRATHRAEGSRGSLSFGRPLYSLDTEWGFEIGASWLVARTRFYQGADIYQLPYPDDQQPTANIPYVYDTRTLSAAGVYTWSFGRYYKTNVSAGYGGYTRRFTAPNDLGLTDDQRSWLTAKYLPQSQNATYVTATVRAFEADYRVLHDIETFALSEDYRLGYEVLFSTRWAEPAFLSPIRYFELTAGSRYRIYVRDNLASVTAAGSVRLVPGTLAVGSQHWVNRRLALELIEIAPPIGFGRFAFRATAELNFADLDKRLLFLGGGDGLRGLAAEALVGSKLVLLNLEYRTRPLKFHTLHIGGVLFWDAGSAFSSSPSLVHSVGVGLRILIPQFNKVPIRIDIGYVLNHARPSWIDAISASYGQVFDYRPALLDDLSL